jgi:hypothetical protein
MSLDPPDYAMGEEGSLSFYQWFAYPTWQDPVHGINVFIPDLG